MTWTRAVVSGGAGFLGSHLVDRLVADGWRVLVIDDLSTGSRERLPPQVRLEVDDIAADRVDAAMEAARPEVLFHLAAQASVPRSVADPVRDEAVNVTGTARLLEAATAVGVQRVVFVSSGGAIYGETARAATEHSAARPASPYGRHKLVAEGLVAAAGVPFAIARPSNIYGPRQGLGLEGAVVATFVARALAREPLRIDGDGTQTRDFIHVADVVQALLRLAGPAVPSGVWNVSTGKPTSILELAALVEHEAGVSLRRVYQHTRAGDIHDSRVSSSKLRRLGWRPEVELDIGLRELLRSGAPGTARPAERGR